MQGGGIVYWNQYRLILDTAMWPHGLELSLHSFNNVASECLLSKAREQEIMS